MEGFPTGGGTFQVARWVMCNLESIWLGIPGLAWQAWPGLAKLAIRKVRVSWKVFAVPPETFLMATEIHTFHDTGGGRYLLIHLATSYRWGGT